MFLWQSLKKPRKKIFCFCYCILLTFSFKILRDALLVVLITTIWYSEKTTGRYICSKHVFSIKMIYCKFYKIKYFPSKITCLSTWCHKCNKIIKKKQRKWHKSVLWNIYLCQFKSWKLLCIMWIVSEDNLF